MWLPFRYIISKWDWILRVNRFFFFFWNFPHGSSRLHATVEKKKKNIHHGSFFHVGADVLVCGRNSITASDVCLTLNVLTPSVSAVMISPRESSASARSGHVSIHTSSNSATNPSRLWGLYLFQVFYIVCSYLSLSLTSYRPKVLAL